MLSDMSFLQIGLWSLGAFLLFAFLVYGVTRASTKNRRKDAVTEKATHEFYDNPPETEETARR